MKLLILVLLTLVPTLAHAQIEAFALIADDTQLRRLRQAIERNDSALILKHTQELKDSPIGRPIAVIDPARLSKPDRNDPNSHIFKGKKIRARITIDGGTFGAEEELLELEANFSSDADKKGVLNVHYRVDAVEGVQHFSWQSVSTCRVQAGKWSVWSQSQGASDFHLVIGGRCRPAPNEPRSARPIRIQKVDFQFHSLPVREAKKLARSKPETRKKALQFLRKMAPALQNNFVHTIIHSTSKATPSSEPARNIRLTIMISFFNHTSKTTLIPKPSPCAWREN